MSETLLCFGESGTTKTSQLAEFAKYQVSRFAGDDLHVRLVSGDSTWKPCSKLVRFEGGKHVGVVRPLNVKVPHPQKLAILTALSEGYWPNEIDEYGIADFSKGMHKDLNGVVGMGWEGLTEVGDVIMQHLTDTQRATGEPLQATFSQSVPGMNLKYDYSGASRGTYGFVQAFTRKYVKSLASLPIDRVLVTAHEGKGVSEMTGMKKTIVGPVIVGTAAVDKISGWFGTTLHFESYMYEDKKRGRIPGVCAYYQRHPDPEVGNIFWPAKLDCPLDVMARVIKRWPQGFIPLQINEKGECVSGIHTLLRMIDEEEVEQ